MAPRPGFVLRPTTHYAVVVLTIANDAQGKPLGVNPTLARMASAAAPKSGEEAAFALYAPLFETLDEKHLERKRVAAATVFTTGAVVEETASLGDAVKARYDVTIDGLTLDANEIYPELCVLRGRATMPQFQEGVAPFDTGGLFAFDADGLTRSFRRSLTTQLRSHTGIKKRARQSGPRCKRRSRSTEKTGSSATRSPTTSRAMTEHRTRVSSSNTKQTGPTTLTPSIHIETM